MKKGQNLYVFFREKIKIYEKLLDRKGYKPITLNNYNLKTTPFYMKTHCIKLVFQKTAFFYKKIHFIRVLFLNSSISLKIRKEKKTLLEQIGGKNSSPCVICY